MKRSPAAIPGQCVASVLAGWLGVFQLGLRAVVMPCSRGLASTWAFSRLVGEHAGIRLTASTKDGSVVDLDLLEKL
jgi:hypothetical protein